MLFCFLLFMHTHILLFYRFDIVSLPSLSHYYYFYEFLYYKSGDRGNDGSKLILRKEFYYRHDIGGVAYAIRVNRKNKVHI